MLQVKHVQERETRQVVWISKETHKELKKLSLMDGRSMKDEVEYLTERRKDELLAQ